MKGVINNMIRLGLMVVPLLLLVACSQDVAFQDLGSLTQAKGERWNTDSFTQGTQGKMLDIIMVVDNSGSMSGEQAKLGERIDTFLATLEGVSWRIGITTTDVSGGIYGLQGSLLEFGNTGMIFIDQNTPDYLELFQSTIVRNESMGCQVDCPSGDEQALGATIMAIEKRNSDNAGFFRQGADLGLLVLTDEDEKSTGPISATQPMEVVQAMYQAFSDEKRLLTYGIIIVPNDTQCLAAQSPDGNYGDFVANLAAMTQGLVGSICEADYAPTLGRIAEHAKELLQYVELRELPDPAKVTITFTPSHSSGFVVDGRRIRITSPPPVGTQIMVNYLVQE